MAFMVFSYIVIIMTSETVDYQKCLENKPEPQCKEAQSNKWSW